MVLKERVVTHPRGPQPRKNREKAVTSLLKRPWFQGLVAGGIIAILVLTINQLRVPDGPGASSTESTGRESRAPGSSGAIETPPSHVKGNEAPPTKGEDPFPPDVALFSWEREEPMSLYPRGCPLAPGKECLVRFLGNYRLMTLDRAILRFGAYENGNPDPVAHYDEPVTRGSEQIIYHLRFVVSGGAKNVQFKVTLLRTDGNLLYEPEPVPPLEVRPDE